MSCKMGFSFSFLLISILALDHRGISMTTLNVFLAWLLINGMSWNGLTNLFVWLSFTLKLTVLTLFYFSSSFQRPKTDQNEKSKFRTRSRDPNLGPPSTTGTHNRRKNRRGPEIRNKSETEFQNLASLPRKPIQARTTFFLEDWISGKETRPSKVTSREKSAKGETAAAVFPGTRLAKRNQPPNHLVWSETVH